MATINSGNSRNNPYGANAPRINIVSIFMLLLFSLIGGAITLFTQNPIAVIAGFLIGLLIAQSPKIARQWERAVVLRLGRFVGLRGPGLFWIVPFVENVSSWIDQRIITT